MIRQNLIKIATTILFLSFLILIFGGMFVGVLDKETPMIVRIGLFFMASSSIVIITILFIDKYLAPKDPYEDIDI